MERTEEQKVFRDPLMVTLAGDQYEIKPLVIKDARVWRRKFAALVTRLPEFANVTTDDANGFGMAVQAMCVEMPDEMADLFFAYAKDLDRKKIETTANELELADAIGQVMNIALPLLHSLTTSLKVR